MCDKAFSEDPFMLKYCFDRCKTQEMCDKAVDDWFITNKMIKKLYRALFSDDDILFF